jgi:uncharacterized protein (TIGR02147 family)
MDHSTLSQLLRGRRRLTERAVRRCCMRLGLDAESVAEFIRAEQCATSSDNAMLREVRRLASDTASLVVEWQHYAILELIRLKDYRPDSRWIARVLGLDVDEVNIALQRLLHLGLLTMDSPHRWSDRTGDASASLRGFTNAALTRLVEQSRQRLLETLGEPESGQCSYSATTLAVSTSVLPEFMERIEQFRLELLALAKRSSGADDVYRLEISFVSLTRLNTLEYDDGTARDRMANRDSPA